MGEVLHDDEPLAGQTVPDALLPLVVTTKYAVTDVAVDGWPVTGVQPSTGRDGQRRTAFTVDLTGAAGLLELVARVNTRGAWTALPAVPVAVLPRRPGPGSTGPRIPRAAMTERPGLRVTTPGQVFVGIVFTGQVLVKRAAVFRDCVFLGGLVGTSRVVSADMSPTVRAAGERLVLDHCEIDGQGTPGGVTPGRGISGSGWQLLACDVHDCNDGAGLGFDCLAEDSWIHDLVRDKPGDLHPDCLQATEGSGSVVRRCTLDPSNAATGDLGNAAVMVGGETGPLTDLLIEDCWVGGGNYSINVRADKTITPGGVIVRGNTYTGGARYGFLRGLGPVLATEGNVTVDGTAARLVR